MAIGFDGVNKIILLDGTTTVSIRAMYSRWIDWHKLSDNSKYLLAFSTIADPPTVPLYATLVNGWLVRPLGGSYILTLNDGFLYRSGGGDPFSPVAAGAEPRIRWENPVIAVGYDSGGGGTLTAVQVREEMDANSTRLSSIKNDTGIIGALV